MDKWLAPPYGREGPVLVNVLPKFWAQGIYIHTLASVLVRVVDFWRGDPRTPLQLR